MSNLLSQFTTDGQRVLKNARRIAKKHKQPIIAPEHLLMGLLQLPGSQGESSLEALRVNLDNLKTRLAASIKLNARQQPEEQPGELQIGYAQGGIKLSQDSKIIVDEAIAEAKENVAEKLGVGIADLADEEVMRQVREDLGIGIITSVAGSPKGIRAKLKIAELLDIPINSVDLFKSQIDM